MLGWTLRKKKRHTDQEKEIRKLRDLILAELGHVTEAQQEFLEQRFVNRYVDAVGNAPWLGRGAAALKLSVATFGLISAGIGAFNADIRTLLLWQVVTIFLGILVGVLTAVDQAWKPLLRHANQRQVER